MSEYTFKNLSEVDSLEAPSGGTTLLGFDGGKAVQMPASAIKGSSVFIIDTTSDEYDETDSAYGNKVKEALLAGDTVYLFKGDRYTTLLGFAIRTDTQDNTFLDVYPSVNVSVSTTVTAFAVNTTLAAISFVVTLD